MAHHRHPRLDGERGVWKRSVGGIEQLELPGVVALPRRGGLGAHQDELEQARASGFCKIGAVGVDGARVGRARGRVRGVIGLTGVVHRRATRLDAPVVTKALGRTAPGGAIRGGAAPGDAVPETPLLAPPPPGPPALEEQASPREERAARAKRVRVDGRTSYSVLPCWLSAKARELLIVCGKLTHVAGGPVSTELGLRTGAWRQSSHLTFPMKCGLRGDSGMRIIADEIGRRHHRVVYAQRTRGSVHRRGALIPPSCARVDAAC